MTSDRPLDGYCVIFDLDGTLVDTAPDLAAATNHVLRHEGFEPVSADKIRHFVGNGAKAMLAAGFNERGVPEITEREMDQHVALFLEHYRVNYAEHSKPFDGLEACLRELQRLGAKLAVCTNKREELAFLVLEAFALADWFDPVICRDSLPVYKPAPEPLLTCVERSGTRRGIMIGDSATDLHAAINAGMDCVLVEFGYGSFSQEDRAKAMWIADFVDLPTKLVTNTTRLPSN